MSTLQHVRAGALSDPGRRRNRNEDRFHADAEAGVFIIIDGVGGHAGGGEAADLALGILRTELTGGSGPPRDRMRAAMIAANNAIHHRALENAEWEHMGCVASAVLLIDGTATIGHVGDTRVYKLQADVVQQITPDHSPVGDLERSGALSEVEALHHPRRNEVYRALGDAERTGAEDFVDLLETAFEPRTALLLSTDGLTDLLPLAALVDIVRTHAGDPEQVVRELIAAANEAGGKDNVTAVFIEGSEFAESFRESSDATVPPTSIARSRSYEDPPVTGRRRSWRPFAVAVPLVLLGALLGAGGLRWQQSRHGEPTGAVQAATATLTSPKLWSVGPKDSQLHTISDAITQARSGDVILVDPGEYRERLVIRNPLWISSRIPGEAVIRIPEGGGDGGQAVVIEHTGAGQFSGFRIVSESARALAVGIAVTDAGLDISDVDISGMYEAGLQIAGAATVSIRASYVHDNGGAGIVVRKAANAQLARNVILRNGTSAGNRRAGVELKDGGRAGLTANVIAGNGVGGVPGLPAPDAARLGGSNLLDLKTPGFYAKGAP